MDPQITTTVMNAIVSILTAMLTPAMGYLIIGSLMLTQAVKWVAIYLHKFIPGPAFWFIVSPLVTGLLAFNIWTDAAVHWIGATLTASLLSNLAYAVFLKRLLGQAAPEVYARLNAPINRRKKRGGRIVSERRRR